jgi:hypothetical protein
MSIGPMESFPPAKSAQAANPSAGSGRAEAQAELGSAAEEAAQPVSGTLPKRESSDAKNVSPSYELPQDVVEVHEDPEIKDQIIIQYLDKAKNVVLQVPSAEELDVERRHRRGISTGGGETAREGEPGGSGKPRRESSWGLALTPRIC